MIDDVQGLRELHDRLQQLPVKVEKNILRGMIRAACKPVLEAARDRAPVLLDADPRRVPGALRKSIRIMSTAVRGSVVMGGVACGSLVKVGRGIIRGLADAFYAKFVEFGTRNMIARPFMRPAADASWPKAVEAGADYARDRVNAGDLK